MGVNAPARAVAFASLRKHDGVGFRDLLPGEYTQMAGRAGRRGLDAVGTVLVPVFGAAGPTDLPGELGLRRLLAGGGARLQSRFRLTYSMILNLLRGEVLTVHDMLRRSFAEYHAARAAPAAAAAATAAAARAAALDAEPWPPHWPPRDEVSAYADAGAILASSSPGVADAPGVLGALTPGRCVVAARTPGGAASPALVLTVRSTATGARDVVLLWLGRDEAVGEEGGQGEGEGSGAAPLGLRLVGKRAADVDASSTDCGPLPRSGSAGGLDYTLAAAPLGAIDAVLNGRLRVDASAALAPPPRGAPPPPALAAAALALARSVEEGHPPPLDPVSGLGVTSLDDAPRARARAAAAAARAASPAAASPHLPAALARVTASRDAAADAASAAVTASHSALAALPEFGARMRVLSALGYVDASDDNDAAASTLALKGRVACEINAGDELVETEALFRGAFSCTSPADAAALLSCFVFQERTDDPSSPLPTPELEEALHIAMTAATDAGAAQAAAGLDVDPSEFASATIRPGLAAAVHAWASGASFREVTDITDVAEGTIVRTVMRVDEVSREEVEEEGKEGKKNRVGCAGRDPHSFSPVPHPPHNRPPAR